MKRTVSAQTKPNTDISGLHTHQDVCGADVLGVSHLHNLCLSCCLSQGLSLWPLVSRWPLTLSFNICIHTHILPGLHLKNVLCSPGCSCTHAEEQRELEYEWFAACLLFRRVRSHIWYIMLSSLCLYLCLSLFSFCPSPPLPPPLSSPSISLMPQSPLQQFLIKIRPQNGGRPKLLLWYEGRRDVINAWELIGCNK